MKMADAKTRDMIPNIEQRQALWVDFYRALAGRNFVRAEDLSRRLDIDEERVRRIRRDALKWFIAEYQNFDAATRLCAEYCITAEEFAALIQEILKRDELASRRTFIMRSGNPAHVSVAEQIREFAQQQIESLKKWERRRSHKSRWRRLVSAVKSKFDLRSGLWGPGGPAYV
jgi:hypothetical protein